MGLFLGDFCLRAVCIFHKRKAMCCVDKRDEKLVDDGINLNVRGEFI